MEMLTKFWFCCWPPWPGPCWWWGCQVWYPASIVSPESPFLAQLKRFTRKRKTGLLCAVHWKAPDSFSICLSAATNKQTNRLQHLTVLRLQFVTFMLPGWADPNNPNEFVIVLRSTRDNLDASLSSRAPSGHLIFICLLPSLFVGWKGKQTNKQIKKDHRSLPAVLAAGSPGQRREVLARHWEDGQPGTGKNRWKKGQMKYKTFDVQGGFF